MFRAFSVRSPSSAGGCRRQQPLSSPSRSWPLTCAGRPVRRQGQPAPRDRTASGENSGTALETAALRIEAEAQASAEAAPSPVAVRPGGGVAGLAHRHLLRRLRWRVVQRRPAGSPGRGVPHGHLAQLTSSAKTSPSVALGGCTGSGHYDGYRTAFGDGHAFRTSRRSTTCPTPSMT